MFTPRIPLKIIISTKWRFLIPRAFLAHVNHRLWNDRGGKTYLERSLCAVSTLADGAPEGLRVVMGSDVSLEVIGARERRRTIRTVEVLLARVQLDVAIQTTPVLEALAAHLALVRQQARLLISVPTAGERPLHVAALLQPAVLARVRVHGIIQNRILVVQIGAGAVLAHHDALVAVRVVALARVLRIVLVHWIASVHGVLIEHAIHPLIRQRKHFIANSSELAFFWPIVIPV